MESQSYKVLNSNTPRKRVCLTCDLKNNPELIAEYKRYHQTENNWPEINKGISDAGIQLMDIFLLDDRMFMICEIDENDDFDAVWAKIGTYPRQSEWEKLMSTFQQAVPGHSLEWVKMEKVFSLP